jgi:transcriptional regulator with XRE-family HTH domain
MDDPRLGSALKSIRLRAGLTQEEVAVAAGVPRSLVGRIERGRIAVVRFGDLRSVAAALDTNVDLIVRWHGGDLGRLINARHAAIHEAGARRFAELEEWVLEPEVSFSSYGERGVIDGLAWHAASRSLLVIELKSEIVDINDLMGSVDRKRRLAAEIGRSRGWNAASVSTWVVVADGRTNRRMLARHASALRLKFPADGHAIAAWLRRPTGTINALGFMPIESLAISGAVVGGAKHVRRARVPLPEPDATAR